MSRIAEDQTNVAVPVIDKIDDNTFQYADQGETNVVGGFTWGLIFNWHSIPESEMKRNDYKKFLPIRYVSVYTQLQVPKSITAWYKFKYIASWEECEIMQ